MGKQKFRFVLGGSRWLSNENRGILFSPEKAKTFLDEAVKKGFIDSYKVKKGGLGVWEGNLEPSYHFEVVAKDKKKAAEFVRKRAVGQEAVYMEGQGGASLLNKGVLNGFIYYTKPIETKTKYKLLVRVYGRIDPQELAKIITDKTSNYRIVQGGTLKKGVNHFTFESATFYPDEIRATSVQDLIAYLRSRGYYAKVLLVRLKK